METLDAVERRNLTAGLRCVPAWPPASLQLQPQRRPELEPRRVRQLARTSSLEFRISACSLDLVAMLNGQHLRPSYLNIEAVANWDILIDPYCHERLGVRLGFFGDHVRARNMEADSWITLDWKSEIIERFWMENAIHAIDAFRKARLSS